jgi:hypothetical protein
MIMARLLGSRPGQYGFWLLAVLSLVLVGILFAWTTVSDWLVALSVVPVGLLAYVAITRPVFVVYALAFTSPLTSGMARGAVIPFLRANEILLIAYVAAAVVTFLARKRLFRFTWLDGLILTFLMFRVVVPVVVALVRGNPFDAEAFRVYFGPIQYYFVFRMVVDSVNQERQVRTTLLLILGSSGIVAFVGILQAVQIPGINEFLHQYYPSRWDDPTFLFSPRVTSLNAGDWNGCGLYLAMNVVLGLGVLHFYGRTWQKVFVLAIVFLDLLVIPLTGSFTGTLGLILGCVLIFTLNKPTRAMLRPLLYMLPFVVIILAAVFWPLISHRIGIQFRDTGSLVPTSWAGRMHYWQTYIIPAMERYWLWGVGAQRHGWVAEENYYFFTILKAGIFGLIAYVSMSMILLGRLIRDFRRDTSWRGVLGVVVMIHIIQVLIANMSGSYFELNGVAEIPWLVIGCLMGAGNWGRPKKSHGLVPQGSPLSTRNHPSQDPSSAT